MATDRRIELEIDPELYSDKWLCWRMKNGCVGSYDDFSFSLRDKNIHSFLTETFPGVNQIFYDTENKTIKIRIEKMATDSTLMTNIKELESMLKNLNPHSKVSCIVTASSLCEFSALAMSTRFKKLHVLHPNEHKPGENFYSVSYFLDGRHNIQIRIKSPNQ